MLNGDEPSDTMGLTMIRIETETRDQLKDLGKKGESYDTIIRRLIAAFLEIPPPPKETGPKE